MTLPHNPYVRPLDPIETDEMFGVWSRNLPRLWYLDQRSATRMDAESLYGATLFAIFQSRTLFDSVPVVTDAATVGQIGKTRSLFEAVQIPLESLGGVRNYIRMTSESLPVIDDTATRIRPSTSPVSPIVHNIPPDEGDWHG